MRLQSLPCLPVKTIQNDLYIFPLQYFCLQLQSSWSVLERHFESFFLAASYLMTLTESADSYDGIGLETLACCVMSRTSKILSLFLKSVSFDPVKELIQALPEAERVRHEPFSRILGP